MLVIGQPLWCVVQKIVTSPAASTLTVSALEGHIEPTVQNAGLSLDMILPGMQFDFTIERVSQFAATFMIYRQVFAGGEKRCAGNIFG